MKTQSSVYVSLWGEDGAHGAN